MLVSTLLVALLLSTTSSYDVVDDQPRSCGCAVERHNFFYERRIPSMITEWICQNVGASCGSEGSIPTKVGFKKDQKIICNDCFIFNSVAN